MGTSLAWVAAVLFPSSFFVFSIIFDVLGTVLSRGGLARG